MRYGRVPALALLLLAAVLSCLAAGREADGPSQPTQTLEEDSVYYEELPPVRIIPLDTLEPVDTGAAAPLQGAEVSLSPAEMGAVLAECTLKDGTIIRLFAPAEGLVDGAFLRPGGVWTRFIRLYDEPGWSAASGENATLTTYSAILGQDGFLLRTGSHCAGTSLYRYYWFDSAGGLRELTARLDPVSLDLDGDGTTELAYGIAERGAPMSFYCRRGDGTICRVTPSAYIGGQGPSLAAVEAEGPGPARLIYRYQEGGEERFCAVTLQGGALELELDIVYVPASLENAVLPTAPTLKGTARPHVSVTSPDGWIMDGAGDAVCLDLWSILWEGPYAGAGGAVVVPTDAPLQTETAYTVTFSSPEGTSALSWTLDAAGICRFDGMEGNFRLVRTGGGSPPACCHDLLRIYCEASRNSRDYDSQGHWLGRSLPPAGADLF